MAFNQERVVELVTEFYRSIGLGESTRITVRPNLDAALRLATRSARDVRSRRSPLRRVGVLGMCRNSTTSPWSSTSCMRSCSGMCWTVRRSSCGTFWEAAWSLTPENMDTVPEALAEAFRNGLCWLIAAHGKAILVPKPIIRVAEGRGNVLHDDTGRMAVVWPDGHGYYFLHGVEFDRRRYFQIIDHVLLIQDIAALDNADHRAVALQYLTFEQLVVDSDAILLDRGIKGTTLYQLPLPPRIARDRTIGYGDYDYFIHMRDASHAEREFLEWADPEIGRQCNAELCQAHAFGISLGDWLAIEQEG